MLYTQQVAAVLARVTYMPGYTFEVYEGRWEGHHIVIRTNMPDAYNPGGTVTLDVHSMLPPMRDEQAVLEWLGWRLARLANHEVREFLRVDGRCLFDPHADGADQDRGDLL